MSSSVGVYLDILLLIEKKKREIISCLFDADGSLRAYADFHAIY